MSQEFDEAQKIHDDAIRNHCSGCPKCQGDYGCTIYASLVGKRYLTLLKAFPNNKEVIELQFKKSLPDYEEEEENEEDWRYGRPYKNW